MPSLLFSSCMAPNSDATSRKITKYIGQQLQIETKFINHISWQERERLFDAGEIQICWICGLPYIWKVDKICSQIELLVVPVMEGERYQGKPVYYSDVIVHQNSPFHHFADLAGSRWAYNEPRSHSGYNIIRYYLAQKQLSSNYFGKIIETGSHQTAIQMLLNGEIDAAAIDSTVLETERRNTPAIDAQIRVIETLGPSPIPPWIIRKEVPATLRQSIRDVLSNMHKNEVGRRILATNRLHKFIVVADEVYDPLRIMDLLAQRIHL